ncbi:MAG TPA: dTMP kinase [Terriglobales bacterium]|nr:dTMP kinase [Terriglobales bacterium]
MARCYDAAVSARRGKFITFEGLDGCGKSTQLEKLAEVLRGDGLDVVTTRQPGGTEIGERVRAIVLNSGTANLSPTAELALMFAARAQLIAEVIDPALAAGKYVLCDRFTDSSEAYQGAGRGLGSAAVLDVHRVICGNLQPDFTVVMDSDPAASVERARRRNTSRHGLAKGDENRFEQESRAFFERVRNQYLEIARRDAHRVFLVNARRPLELVHGEIVAAVRERLLAPVTRGA